ncbi:chemotaxis protein [Vibrio vulnificus]|uniref:chemotaxis protein n=1 Tax=Vibrio vulnificus TaxID=672 RepID=UPI001CDB6C7E|nr:chemotaxis protein [Vibrio vulnificus]EHZ7358374.1 chemotaxis protein [Vibrio vulnificus]EIJ0948379.1 chemotaxis protein [Vibrio vulnificus]EIT7142690.1 chemotaxis protein [Vibrio vulnificus]EJO2021505.1 chemotaxis protein [Vibrio vulnificus]ELG9630535.1 chemotaxis protein [Vibrio vulnificus]
MGGKSSSKNTTTTSNNSGQNAISGDNLGTAISGINNSTLNVTATDHGAIEAAGNLAELSMTTMGSLAGDTVKSVTDFSKDALKTYSATNSENLSMMAGLAGSQAAQNAENLNAVMELAKFKQDNGANEQREDAELTKKLAIGAFAAISIAYLVTRS